MFRSLILGNRNSLHFCLGKFVRIYIINSFASKFIILGSWSRQIRIYTDHLETLLDGKMPLKQFIALSSTIIIFSVTSHIVFVVTKNLVEFKYNERKIIETLRKNDPGNMDPPLMLKEFVRISHEDGLPLESAVTRKILSKLGVAANEKSIVWQERYFIWTILVKSFLSDEDVYGLYCALSFNGVDYGAENLANRVFGKTLKELTQEEAASVAAILWSPSRYKRKGFTVSSQRDYLIYRYREENNEMAK